MAIFPALILDMASPIIAFCGHENRVTYLRRIAVELVHAGKKVIIAATGPVRLPVSGDTVLGSDIHILTRQLQVEFTHRSLITVGKSLSAEQIAGFSPAELAVWKDHLPADYLLIDLLNAENKPLWEPTEARKLVDVGFWDQLLYFLDVSEIDRPAKGLPDGGASTFSQAAMMNYLTNGDTGIRHIFEQQWPALLIFSGADLPARENRALTLSRELWNAGIQHIAVGDGAADIIKKLNFG